MDGEINDPSAPTRKQGILYIYVYVNNAVARGRNFGRAKVTKRMKVTFSSNTIQHNPVW